MATIITFRGKEKVSPVHHFLTDETEKLSFQASEDGGVSILKMPPFSLPSSLPDPRKDWRNQELADLFRVKELLSNAGVPVETMRGVTDEGDPWFVFCHLNGDVFIHMARIDSVYVLDSPNLCRPLGGADFNALIEDFTNNALPSSKILDAEDETKLRIVRLDRGGKVRLHPSAMLAALIWTLFLASEELVLLTSEEQVIGLDDLLDYSAINFPTGFEFQSVKTETADVAGLKAVEAAKSLSAADAHHEGPETQNQMRDTGTGHQGLTMHQNAFALGLSTIAIAMGLMSEAVMYDNQRKVLDGLKSLGLLGDGQDTQAATSVDIAYDTDASTVIANVMEFLGVTFVADTVELVEEIKTSLLQEQLMQMGNQIAATSQILTQVKEPQSSELQDERKKSNSLTDVYDNALKSAEILVTAREPEATKTKIAGEKVSLSLSEVIEAWQQTQSKVIKVDIIAFTADVDMSIADAYTMVTEYRVPSEISSSANSYDPMSQRLIDFFVSKGSDIDIVEQENGFLAVDHEALKSGNVSYMEWQTDDGKLIGLIGLLSDFAHFDMIA